MKKNILKYTGFIGAILLLFSLYSYSPIENKTVKCLIQTTNYEGEGAYIVVSLMDPEGNYEKTLYMQGQDEEWYNTLEQWWENIGENAKDIDAISGATVSPGGRAVVAFEVPSDKIGKGYSLRFESAVEDKDYYEEDLELPLTAEALKGKFEGKGYIRYIRLIAN